MVSPDILRDRSVSFGKFTRTFWYQHEFSLFPCAKILASGFPTGDRRQQWACWYQDCWIHISSGRSSGNQIQQISSPGHPERLREKYFCAVTMKNDYEGRKGGNKWGFNRKGFQTHAISVIHPSPLHDQSTSGRLSVWKMQEPLLDFIPFCVIMERILDLHTRKLNVSGNILWVRSYLEHHRFIFLQGSSLPLK